MKPLLPLLLLFSVTSPPGITAVGESEEAVSRSDGVVRWRISGVLLFVSNSGLELTTKEVLSHGFGGINKLLGLGPSRIKGDIILHLPDDVIGEKTATIFSRSSYSEVAFGDHLFFTHEFDMPATASMGKEIKIECNLEGKEQGTICEGTQSYRVNVPQIDTKDAIRLVDLSELIDEIIAEIGNRLGYEKLYRSKGYSKLVDVIYALLHLSDIDLPDIPKFLENLGGVYLINAVLEKVSDDVLRPGPYKKIDDSWRIHDNNDWTRQSQLLYGQLYVLPQAKIIPLGELLDTIVDLPDWAKDIALPLIRGPAFPLFDMPRLDSTAYLYRLSKDLYNRFNVYYKNPDDHSYVVFSNMWEKLHGSDGCIARGRVFGFDKVTVSSDTEATLSNCIGEQNYSVLISQNEEVVTDNITLHELTGVFEFWAKDEDDNITEPYGYFDIAYKGLIKRVWNQPDHTSMQLPEEEKFHLPFHYSYSPNKPIPYSNANALMIDGFVMEDDVTSADDTIGNFEDFVINPDDIMTEKWYHFPGGDGHGQVDIMLHLLSDYQHNLVEYELFGTFEFKGQDGVFWVNPSGDFTVEIRHRAINMKYRIWQGLDDKSVEKWYTQPFKIRFRESESFITSKERAIVLHGRVMGEDNNLIGDYEGSSFKPSTLSMGSGTCEYPGEEDGSLVRVQLALRYVGKAREDNADSLHDELLKIV